MKFYKYQSLGNDFILFDYVDARPEIEFVANQVKKMCDRHVGIGADGILIVSSGDHCIGVRLINADGSTAEKCYNGLRCTAHHLRAQRSFPKQFQLIMSGHVIGVEIQDHLISMNVGQPKYKGEKIIEIENQKMMGHIVDVGNPHFVVFKKIELDWLKKYGYLIENNEIFPHKTNVEFVWGNKSAYDMLVHERGCGITLACGTGCAAVIQALFELNKITINQQITINMQGGKLTTYLNDKKEIIQRANAEFVFDGTLK